MTDAYALRHHSGSSLERVLGVDGAFPPRRTVTTGLALLDGAPQPQLRRLDRYTPVRDRRAGLRFHAALVGPGRGPIESTMPSATSGTSRFAVSEAGDVATSWSPVRVVEATL